MARESVDLRILERLLQRHTRSVRPQARDRECAQSIEDIPGINIPGLGEESADPSLDATIVALHHARYRIEALTRLHCVSLDEVAKCKHRGKRVGELHKADRCRDADEAEEIRDRGGDDESDCPVDWNDTGPDPFAAFGEKGRRVEKFHQDVVVEDFDTDVAVQRGRDKGTDDGKHVACCLPAIGRDALVRNLSIRIMSVTRLSRDVQDL